jgi:RNA polymerase sigma-70 factor (ECF subfamily)
MLLLAVFLCAARADDITVQSAQPVVVKTLPQAGATDIDAKLGEIQVTFSKDMMDGSWSWSTVSRESFPKLDGQPKYLQDKRTCVLPVKLEPGKTYALWVNTERFTGFKDADGRTAVPYLLVFQTRKAPGDQPPKPASTAFDEETLGRRFDDLWTALDRNYSYFIYKKDVDWQALKERYRPQAIRAKNTKEFVAIVGEMLAHLKDLHVWLDTPQGPIASYRSSYRRNWNRQATLALLEEQRDCGFAVVGKVKGDGFGYFLMVDQGRTTEAGVRQATRAIRQLSDTPGFIVDLRSASGGDERKARQIAQLFCGGRTVYAKSKFRNGVGHDQFTQDFERTLEPSRQPFTKPVVCLIGPGAVSSGEAFVQMMRCLPHVTTVGLPTRGASGNPQPFELADMGIKIWFSRWVDMLPDGSTFEGAGITPAMTVDADPQQYDERDPTLEKGLEVLREKVRAKSAQ